MADDIVTRLRDDYCGCSKEYTSRGLTDPHCESCSTKAERNEAADEIERLRFQLDQATLSWHPASRAALDRMNAARAVLAPSQTGSVNHWQPIGTAPKGRKVIVHYLNPLGNARVVMARYYPQHTLEMDDDPGGTGDYDEASGVIYAPEGWYEEHDSDEPILPLGGVPSHWTAVPAPPGAELPASEPLAKAVERFLHVASGPVGRLDALLMGEPGRDAALVRVAVGALRVALDGKIHRPSDQQSVKP